MKLDLQIGARGHQVEIERRGGRLHFHLDGQEMPADAREVAPGIYSVLLGGNSYEARVEPVANALRVHIAGREYAVKISDPRQWRRSRGGAEAAEGREQIQAPMPGKVVRALVKAGDAVEAGQGLVVVEAMKMQNEVKSPKAGKVEKLLVRKGQTVNAGETLAIIA